MGFQILLFDKFLEQLALLHGGNFGELWVLGQFFYRLQHTAALVLTRFYQISCRFFRGGKAI